MIEEMKIKDVISLLNIINPSKERKIIHNGEEVRIVILQRGWVVIGNFYQNGSDCWITNGYVIRQWGTERGLGELAIEGKKVNTKLDPIPLTKFHELTIVASILCDKSKWKDLC